MSTPGDSSDYYTDAELAPLARRGVQLPGAGRIAIHRSVPLDAIAGGSQLHPFTRLTGGETRIDAGAQVGRAAGATVENSWIGADAVIGDLGPVTLRDSVAGPGTVLGCGVAEHAVFLGREGAEPAFTAGYGFRARRGTLYEEGANSAQFTDTKMTILLPWVTLGSGVNWCDLLVAGGTGPGPGQFSEVGSGCIHFNFTPRGDKATASLFGNAADGVFLDQPRLFIGGHASLIGPLAADFGAVTAAGGRFTRHLRPGLNPGEPPPADQGAFDPDAYGAVLRLVRRQAEYIGELAALDAWYTHGRRRLAAGNPIREECYRRAQALVRANLRERIAQLEALAGRMPASAAKLRRAGAAAPLIAQQEGLHRHWPELRRHLEGWTSQIPEPPPALVRGLETAGAQEAMYTRAVASLPAEAKTAGRAWLREIRTRVATGDALGRIPPMPLQ
jgi:UDP-N-acetylglucosamine/UDP-N-acetylgalactosamine diphosphorylase